jgi:hypothetical protein
MEIAKLMCTGLAQLVATAEPAKLHVERGGIAAGAVGQCDGGDGDAGTGLQQRSTTQDCSGPCHDETPVVLGLPFKVALPSDRDLRNS